MREFLCMDIENFEKQEESDQILTQAECIKIIEYELNNLRHDYGEIVFDQNITIQKYEGISIIKFCRI